MIKQKIKKIKTWLYFIVDCSNKISWFSHFFVFVLFTQKRKSGQELKNQAFFYLKYLSFIQRFSHSKIISEKEIIYYKNIYVPRYISCLNFQQCK